MAKKNKTTSYVCEINNEQCEKLRCVLEGRGWEFSPLKYAKWKARFEKTNVTAYDSGKLTVQGGGAEELVLFLLEPEILKKASLGYEMESGEGGVSEATFSPHAGMDESGKGDFFGPLCVASVFVDSAAAPILKKAGVTDSKKIKGAARISFLACEVKNAVGGKFATVSVGPEAYNRLYGKFGNLNHLLAWAHAKALENLLEKAPECRSALADKFGNEKLIINALQEKGRGIELTQKTKAESDIAVAAASIIARDSFLKGMKKLERVLDIKLPLGAGAAVLETAAEIIEKKGIAALDSVSKKHFATRGKACNLCTIR